MREVGLALRSLRATPGFSIAALLTLTLGIGANTAVFTLLHAVVLAPLPYADPGRIVLLSERTPGLPIVSVTRDNYEAWRDRAGSFSSMAAVHPASMTLSGAGEPEQLPVTMITVTLLPLLGVHTEQGRAFSDRDDRPGAEAVALVSAGFARRRFAGGAVVGRVLHLDGRPYSVVGVLPAGFELLQAADVFLPFGPWAATLPADRGWHPGIWPIARLKDGVSLDQARDDMDAIARQLEDEWPDSNIGVRVSVDRAQDQLIRNARPALLMLAGAVALVLLIACANVANLLMVRAVGRRREIAVRIALGASRLRIVRQLAVESLLLGWLGGAAGLLLAWWGVSFLTLTGATAALPRAGRIAVDWPVAWFAAALSAASGLAFGLASALHATGFDIRALLNEEGRGVSASRGHRRLRATLVVGEIALALVLLVAAGQVFRSFSALTSLSPGFDASNLLVASLPLPPARYADAGTRDSLAGRLLARVAALPGIEQAALTTTMPMAGAGGMLHFNRVSHPPSGPADYVAAGYRAVTPGYFAVLKVPLVRGRLLDRSDTGGAPRVVVINEAMVRQYFAGRDPLGERIRLGTEPTEDAPPMRVVGIVGDVRQSFQKAAQPEMFVPFGQQLDALAARPSLNLTFVARTTGEPSLLAPSVREALREMDPAQAVVEMRTMEAALAGTVAQPRLQMSLLALFAVLAVALAAVGVYGVMAYTVSQRTAEIGIRMALGASRVRVVGLVVAEGARLAIIGIGIGLVAAVSAGRGLAHLSIPIERPDVLTFVVAPAVLGAAAIVASALPALRAARPSSFRALHH